MRSLPRLLVPLALPLSLALGFAPPASARQAPAPVTASARPDLAPLIAGNTAFALDLYRELAGKPGNFFYAPSSLSAALAMVHAGAGGETAAEMARVLHLPSLPEVDARYGALLAATEGHAGYELSVANRLWGADGARFERAYLALTRRHYGAALASLDFHRAEAARAIINRWVAHQTHDRIPELLPAGAVDGGTRLVLTNAIYFKGQWQTKFDARLTRDAPFTRQGGTKVTAPLMHRTGDYAYFHDGDVDGLELPYAGGDLSMVVLLPSTPDGLAALEQRLTPAQLETWTRALHPTEVDVALPRFKLRTSLELTGTLEHLGMTHAFSDAADFSHMSSSERLQISSVIHQAFVQVDESGTEAAGATGVVIRATAMMLPTQFHADRPFLFLLRDKRTGSVLFVGRVADPTA